MRSLVLYVSFHHLNTEKVAREIAITLKSPMADLFSFDGECLEDFDHISFGSGVYFWRTHQQLLRLLEGFPP